MNKIILNNIIKDKNTIKYKYTISGEWKKYFTNDYDYYITYEFNIEEIPLSICAIPFMCNILPMVWIFNAEIELEEIDLLFYQSISEFKNGFVNMYPQVDFKGIIKVHNIVKNEYAQSEQVGQFFSGGVDAFSTLVTHINEKPLLINLQGSDLNLNDDKTVDNVKIDILSTAKKLKLNATLVKSTFKNVINHKNINKYIIPIIKDNYWHGIQHGTAIIGHAAPIAYEFKLKKIYIAASFTKEANVPCASDPTIDNFIKLSKTEVLHDGYNYNRKDKINNIINFCKNNNQTLKLRVCLSENSANNCCKCEKCYRTIYEIIVNDYDPHKLGFNYDENLFKRVKKDFNNRIVLGHVIHWKRIQKTFIEKKAKYENDERFNWIFTYDFNTKMTTRKLIYKIYFALVKRFKKYILGEHI